MLLCVILKLFKPMHFISSVPVFIPWFCSVWFYKNQFKSKRKICRLSQPTLFLSGLEDKVTKFTVFHSNSLSFTFGWNTTTCPIVHAASHILYGWISFIPSSFRCGWGWWCQSLKSNLQNEMNLLKLIRPIILRLVLTFMAFCPPHTFDILYFNYHPILRNLWTCWRIRIFFTCKVVTRGKAKDTHVLCWRYCNLKVIFSSIVLVNTTIDDDRSLYLLRSSA